MVFDKLIYLWIVIPDNPSLTVGFPKGDTRLKWKPSTQQFWRMLQFVWPPDQCEASGRIQPPLFIKDYLCHRITSGRRQC